MAGETCHCNQACYLREYGRQSWTNTSPLRSRLVWHRGLITMESRFRTGGTRRSRSWIHGASLVALATLLLMAIASVAWLSHGSHQDEEVDYSDYYKPDAKLTRILRSLNRTTANSQSERHLTDNGDNNESTTALFPWLQHRRALPNYFLGDGIQSADEYARGAVVFIRHLHHSQSASLLRCLSNISLSKSGYSLSEWHDSYRHTPKPEHSHRKLHVGHFTMGLCDAYRNGGCSYASVFEEPMSRAVSGYYRCKNGTDRLTDERCRTFDDVSGLSLRDWILAQGSVTFQQLAFDAAWCREFETPADEFSPEGSTATVAPSGEWPCWLKRRWFLDRLAPDRRAQILNHVIDRLDRWLAVVGLADDWRSTVGILERVFELPLAECAGMTSLPAHTTAHSDNRANGDTQHRGYYDENDPDYLRYDYFVRRALEADFRIYKRAKQIFNVQRQMTFNQINR